MITPRGYYFITHPVLSGRGIRDDVKDAVTAEVTVVQYRPKNISTRDMLKEAASIKKMCRGKCLFIVNDRVDVALAVSADGVHLGQSDMPYALARRMLGDKKIIGVSVSTVREAEAAERDGADYLGVGPVFPTDTKKDAGKGVGLKVLAKIREKCRIPIVAIGGITLENAPRVIEAGADSVCAISAVVTKKDVKKEIKRFQHLFNKK
jgi:thiamine-phosphate pyrophosphorylase